MFFFGLGMFTFDEEMKQTSHYQVKANDATPFGLSSDDDDDSSTDGKHLKHALCVLQTLYFSKLT